MKTPQNGRFQREKV